MTAPIFPDKGYTDKAVAAAAKAGTDARAVADRAAVAASTLWVPSPAFKSAGPGVTEGVIDANAPGMNLAKQVSAANVDTTVVTVVQVPPWATKVTATAHWIMSGGAPVVGTGDAVRLRGRLATAAPGGDYVVPSGGDAQVTATADGEKKQIRTVLHNARPVPSGSQMSVRVVRMGTNAEDTYAGQISMQGVSLLFEA